MATAIPHISDMFISSTTFEKYACIGAALFVGMAVQSLLQPSSSSPATEQTKEQFAVKKRDPYRNWRVFDHQPLFSFESYSPYLGCNSSFGFSNWDFTVVI